MTNPANLATLKGPRNLEYIMVDYRGLALCVISAVGFSTWPLLARYSGASQGWVALMIFLPAALVNLILTRQSLAQVPDQRMLAFLTLGALCDVAALVAYTKMLGEGYSFSGLMTANIIIMVVWTSLGGVLLLGEPLTRDKVLGYLLGGLAAWLLTKNSSG